MISPTTHIARVSTLSVLLFTLLGSLDWAIGSEPLKWQIQKLAVDANEGIDIADFNRDGKLDIIAGRNWYAAPDYSSRPVRHIEDWNGYVESNGDFAYDVDKDGFIDVIAGSFKPTEVYWYRNPGAQGLKLGRLWEQRLLVDTGDTTNEGQLFQDLDGDGKPEWIVNSWRNDVPMHVWRLGTAARQVSSKVGNKTEVTEKKVPTLHKSVIGDKGNGHGMGIGDLNGDGNLDILVGQGWYECPSKDRFATRWLFHPDWKLHASDPIIVRDLNGDGRNDLVLGVAHGFGLHWWEQLAPAADGTLAWKKHLIDDSFSQPHALHMADLTGDKKLELITGKRVFAHNGNDPGGKLPPCIFYYTWDAATGKFTRQVIDQGHVGTGLQIRTADLDQDGRVDIAVAGKSGTYILWNKGF